MSLIDEFGALYLASRLERLSENLKRDAARIFKTHLPGIKYKWYPVIISLHKRQFISVVELANELSYAHPTIIDILNELEDQNIIRSSVDKSDNRKRLLSLTAKGNRLLNEMLPLIKAFEITVTDLIDNKNHLLKALKEVESKIEDETFFTKVNRLVKSKPASKVR